MPKGGRFCLDCGAALPRACPACGYDNPAHAKFCAECGATIAAELSESRSPIATEHPAERRQLTIMFCDMVGSGELATQFDPEEQRDIVGAFQAC
jgi:class 3 adenylate cyclase